MSDAQGTTPSSSASGCAKFFMTQDGCAAPSPSNNCRPKITFGSIQQFMSGGDASMPYSPFGRSSTAKSSMRKRSPQQLSSAMNTTNTSQDASSSKPAAMVESTGLCGAYDSAEAMGVCLWSGPDANSQVKGDGWLGIGLTTNCRKEIMFQRTGSSESPIKGTVLDGCNFGTTQPSFGCSQIFLSKKSFMAMKPSPEEMANGFLKDSITWDFASKSEANNMPM